MAELYRYAAFISYSSADARFARRVHRALESYGIPSQLGKFDLIGGGKRNRIYPVFRDREEAAAGALREAIEAALKASGSLVVVCSANAAKSPWVEKEIEFFGALGRGHRIFAIIADTAPLTDADGSDATVSCFPPALRGKALQDDNALEPLAGDARPGKDEFRNAWLKIVAGLIGVSPGQLIDRDRIRERRRRIGRGAAVTAAAVIAVTVASGVEEARMHSAMLAQARFLIRGANVDERLPAVFSAFAAPGSPLAAAPFAIAGVPPAGALAPAEDGATRALLETGLALPHLARLGFGTDVQFSKNGERVIALTADQPQGLIGRSYDRIGNVMGARPSPKQYLQAWDATTGKPVLAMREAVSITAARPLFSSRKVDGLFLSDDGRRLALITEGRSASLWDLSAGKKISDLGGHVTSIVASPDGAHLVVGNEVAKTALFDMASGREVATLPVVGMRVAVFSPDGAFLVVAGSDNFLLWNVKTGRQIAALRETEITGAEFNAPATAVALGGGNYGRFTSMVLTLPNGELVKDFSLTDPQGFRMEFVAGGARIVAFTGSGAFRILDVERKAVIVSTQFDRASRPYWNANSDQVALVLDAGGVEVWDARAGKKLAVVPTKQTPTAPQAALSADGSRLLIAHADGAAVLLSMADGRTLRSWTGVSAIDFVESGGNLVATDAKGESWFVDGVTGRDRFRLGRLQVSQSAFGPQGGVEQAPVVQIQNRLAIIAPDGSGALRDAASGQPIASLFGSSIGPKFRTIAEGRRFLTQSDDGLAMWDTATGKRIAIMGGTRTTRIMGLSHDGRKLVLGSLDGMFLVDADWTADLMPQGSALRERVCGANRRFVAHFSPDVRNKGELRDFLRGRPWHPCDWRGLGAIWPNAAGDSWFEGPRQWLRLQTIRFGLASDYQPDERVAGVQ